MKYIRIFILVICVLIQSCEDKERETPPSIETLSIKLIDISTVEFTGEIYETGSLPISDYGFVYGTGSYPTIESGTKISLGKTPAQGIVTKEVSITARYTLFVRMYLTNSRGTAYGKLLNVEIPDPAIIRMEPTFGKVGTLVNIYGSNFSPNVAGNAVRFGNTPAKVVAATISMLTVEVPDFSSRYSYADYIYITVGGWEIRSPSSFILFPEFTGYTPQNGGFRTIITINGDGFKTDSYSDYDRGIYLGDIRVYATYVDANTIEVKVPDEIKNSPVKITYRSNGKIEEIGLFTIDSPVIESFSPETGMSGLTKIEVNGKNFNPESNILKIGNIEMRPSYADYKNNFNTVSQAVPQSLESGSYDIMIFNGIEWATAATKLDLIAPAVTAISSEAGYGGSEITFTGNFFDYLKKTSAWCLFGEHDIFIHYLNVTTVGTLQQITVTVPTTIKKGLHNISFNLYHDDFPDIHISTPFDYQVLPASINDFSPSSGVAGSTVKITGEGLLNSEVYFSTTQASIISSTPTELEVRVPSGIEGKIKISVVSYEDDTMIFNDDFTVLE